MPPKTVAVGSEKFKVYITERKIQKRVKDLASAINRDYRKKSPVLLCILNGAVFFYTDLLRHLTIDCEVAFLSLSSYADAMTSSGRVKLKSPLPLVLPGRDVIIVEDIIDTGETLHYLENALRKIKVKSYSVAALLHKPEKTKRKIKLKYVGFKIPNHFVIGYGLDLKQKRRNLRDIYQHIE